MVQVLLACCVVPDSSSTRCGVVLFGGYDGSAIRIEGLRMAGVVRLVACLHTAALVCNTVSAGVQGTRDLNWLG